MPAEHQEVPVRENIVIDVLPLTMPWPTLDPFLFCVHHNDASPAGDKAMGPKASLAGRAIGQDFSGRDGWSMYHGDRVPGFPQHPHRGFETVTVARQGYIDHSDSLGAAARFGNGDLQWMTAGKGIVHSEMFPLIHADRSNPTELFQIWLNLPARNKMVAPYFSMFWDQQIPKRAFVDASGISTTVVNYCGRLPDADADALPPTPPPDSWAADPNNDVAIWTIAMPEGAAWTLPAGHAASNRRLYFFAGARANVAGYDAQAGCAITLRADAAVEIRNGDQPSEFLLLQGRPIGEPVAQHGPFVMNTMDELRAAFGDYQTTRFGGWPWPDGDPVHGRDETRFARYPDGRVERPPAARQTAAE
jgi:redox-sensitive bicupin YhaK (pirin superfamily)